MADDEKTGPSGKPIWKRVAGPRTGAGHVALRVEAVHTYECPYWHMGRRHGPCNCGANDLMERIAANHGAVVPCVACGTEAVHVDLGVFGYTPQAHRSPQGFSCHGHRGAR